MVSVVASPNSEFDSYYARLSQVEGLGITREEALRPAFLALLERYSREAKWVLVAEERLANGKRPDGTLYDSFKIPRGFWEAKDTKDDLEKEIAGKLKIGYPTVNTIFEDTRTAVLYQNKQRVFVADLTKPASLAELLTRFFNHTDERIDEYHRAVTEFGQRIPDLARGLMKIIADQRDRDYWRDIALAERGLWTLRLRNEYVLRATPDQLRAALIQRIADHLVTSPVA